MTGQITKNKGKLKEKGITGVMSTNIFKASLLSIYI